MMTTSAHFLFELRKPGAFDRTPCTEESIQRRPIADDAQRNAPRLPYHATRNQDDAVQERPKLHADVPTTITLPLHHHGKPRLDVPGQGGHDHVSPVAEQVIHRQPQGVDPVLELLDDVFLVAAFVGARDVGGAHGGVDFRR